MSVDLPSGVDNSRSGKFTAIPGNVLGHLRHTTGLPVEYFRGSKITTDRLPSKIRALLHDLPHDELSVVFASSRAIVSHLLHILRLKNFGCRGLFNGQTVGDSELAVSEWQNDPSVKVLVVQSGAAACGLTLTAACKMFLMEPFLRHQEERQAYARLHRFGQLQAVDCKVYFTPVSVESRLLEWRRLSNSHEADETTEVYAPIRVENFSDPDESGRDESKQTTFLLGLENEFSSQQ